MTPSSVKAKNYRKRAVAVGKRLKGRLAPDDRVKLVRKQKALNDMAENEDWLDGKPGSQAK
jgi:hypothetical protein